MIICLFQTAQKSHKIVGYLDFKKFVESINILATAGHKQLAIEVSVAYSRLKVMYPDTVKILINALCQTCLIWEKGIGAYSKLQFHGET